MAIAVPQELLRPEVLVWVMLCVFVSVGIGAALGRGVALRYFHRKMRTDRHQLVKALQVLLESTEQLSSDVGTHKTELATVERSVSEWHADGDFEPVQEFLLQQISAVVQSHKRLEDDLVVTRYQLQEQAQELDRTRTEAMTDVLSGLVNRKAFNESLQFAVSSLKRTDLQFALALADVDHFKRINDTHGHDAGDRVVARIGQVLKDHCRDHDIVARFGGDEFAIIFTSVDEDQAAMAAQRLRTAIERSNFDAGADGARIAVTFSIGLAPGRPSDTADTIFKRADTALYRAKKSGRNCICVENTLSADSGSAAGHADCEPSTASYNQSL